MRAAIVRNRRRLLRARFATAPFSVRIFSYTIKPQRSCERPPEKSVDRRRSARARIEIFLTFANNGYSEIVYPNNDKSNGWLKGTNVSRIRSTKQSCRVNNEQPQVQRMVIMLKGCSQCRPLVILFFFSFVRRASPSWTRVLTATRKQEPIFDFNFLIFFRPGQSKISIKYGRHCRRFTIGFRRVARRGQAIWRSELFLRAQWIFNFAQAKLGKKISQFS